MIDALVGDLEKEVQEMEFEEKDAQDEYEEFIEDSANRRAIDSKSFTDKETTKASHSCRCRSPPSMDHIAWR